MASNNYMRHANTASRASRQAANGLYSAARVASTFSALASGDPTKIARRAKNIAVGRLLARMGVWR